MNKATGITDREPLRSMLASIPPELRGDPQHSNRAAMSRLEEETKHLQVAFGGAFKALARFLTLLEEIPCPKPNA